MASNNSPERWQVIGEEILEELEENLSTQEITKFAIGVLASYIVFSKDKPYTIISNDVDAVSHSLYETVATMCQNLGIKP